MTTSRGGPSGQEENAPDPLALLAWYDTHRRSLPWRAAEGAQDPWRVWVSEIMLQQTTAKAVEPYYRAFVERFPTADSLAGAPLDEVMRAWAGLGYYARARNLHAAAREVRDRHGGRIPDTEEGLRALPGVGAYTAAAIAAIGFGRRTVPVDGNVERVVSRLYRVEEPLPRARPLFRRLAQGLAPDRRPGDFAQALMDLGATICTVRRPACALCPWRDPCAAGRAGDAEDFPRKPRKPARPLRRAAAFHCRRAPRGEVLLRTRPPDGLFGGLAELPSTPWSGEGPNGPAGAPLDLAWRQVPGTVRHVLTHMELELTVYAGEAPAGAAAPAGMRWVPPEALAAEPLSSLMRKVLAHAEAGAARQGGAFAAS